MCQGNMGGGYGGGRQQSNPWMRGNSYGMPNQMKPYTPSNSGLHPPSAFPTQPGQMNPVTGQVMPAPGERDSGLHPPSAFPTAPGQPNPVTGRPDTFAPPRSVPFTERAISDPYRDYGQMPTMGPMTAGPQAISDPYRDYGRPPMAPEQPRAIADPYRDYGQTPQPFGIPSWANQAGGSFIPGQQKALPPTPVRPPATPPTRPAGVPSHYAQVGARPDGKPIYGIRQADGRRLGYTGSGPNMSADPRDGEDMYVDENGMLRTHRYDENYGGTGFGGIYAPRGDGRTYWDEAAQRGFINGNMASEDRVGWEGAVKNLGDWFRRAPGAGPIQGLMGGLVPYVPGNSVGTGPRRF